MIQSSVLSASCQKNTCCTALLVANFINPRDNKLIVLLKRFLNKVYDDHELVVLLKYFVLYRKNV